MGLCIGIMSFWIMYGNGQTSHHAQLVTQYDKTRIDRLLEDILFIKEFDIYKVYQQPFQKFNKAVECPQ